MPTELDLRIAAFSWIRERELWNGGIFSGIELNQGFTHQGRQITLKGQKGIWFPQGFEMPISISTSRHGPYLTDAIGEDGLLTYAYRGDDPQHPDNVGLRKAWRMRTPLIYFQEVHSHRYQAIWPIIVIEDNPEQLQIRAALDPAYSELRPDMDPATIPLSPLDLRRYAWIQTRQRLHQEAFRDIVIAAYNNRCTICRLNHPELLDAAHIIPDVDERGIPVVQNGLSLCKIHHAAYDKDILGITPDYQVRIRKDILEEHDGPMLRHGLQELDGQRILLPPHRRDHPDRDRLAERFALWGKTG